MGSEKISENSYRQKWSGHPYFNISLRFWENNSFTIYLIPHQVINGKLESSFMFFTVMILGLFPFNIKKFLYNVIKLFDNIFVHLQCYILLQKYMSPFEF